MPQESVMPSARIGGSDVSIALRKSSQVLATVHPLFSAVPGVWICGSQRCQTEPRAFSALYSVFTAPLCHSLPFSIRPVELPPAITGAHQRPAADQLAAIQALSRLDGKCSPRNE